LGTWHRQHALKVQASLVCKQKSVCLGVQTHARPGPLLQPRSACHQQAALLFPYYVPPCPAQGEHAHRIWSAIYNQSCFTDGVTCSEERVFYRLISGMHASISCHLASDYLLDEKEGIWGPNMTEFKQRLGTPETR
jgi:hypothetical protein